MPSSTTESLKETKVPSLTPPRSWRRNVFASAGRFGCLKGIPRAKKELKNNPFTNVKSVSSQYPVQWFSFDNIKNMTDNFDERNILGEGGFKKVRHILFVWLSCGRWALVYVGNCMYVRSMRTAL